MSGPVKVAWPALLFIAACSGEPAPGGVTADEAQQLNDAAAELDANSVDVTDQNGGPIAENEAQP